MEIEKARELGIEAAEEAIRAAGTDPTDVDGESLIPTEYPADWELPDEVEGDEELTEAFVSAFGSAMASECWEVRPSGMTSWAGGLSALEACREKGRAIERGLDRVRINFAE